MISEIRTINLIFAVAGLVLSILGLIQTLMGRNIDRKTRHFFTTLFGTLLVYVLCILIRELTYGLSGRGFTNLSRVVIFGQALFASLLTILITAFLLFTSGDKKWMKNGIFRISAVLCCIYNILLISNLFTGSIYRIEDDNSYQRGPYFSLLIIPTVLIMFVNLFAVWKKRKNLSERQRTAFLVYATVPMVSMILQAKFFGVHLIALSTVVSALFMLTCIMSDQMERYYATEAENSRLKIDILLAQIQPHFLYNSLTVIKHLCTEDPRKAEEAIGQFTNYLRHNMDSLTTDKPIAFEEELKHVKEYVALQKLRFGDELSVEYDLKFMDFSLPTLTLQPLVENAVTYGVRKSESGRGTVKISSEKAKDAVTVCVEDDGPGFDEKDIPDVSGRSHAGISNVRERLERISGGDLIIDSAKGRGTKAIIKIPLGELGNADFCN